MAAQTMDCPVCEFGQRDRVVLDLLARNKGACNGSPTSKCNEQCQRCDYQRRVPEQLRHFRPFEVEV
jgi:hypothetical protein